MVRSISSHAISPASMLRGDGAWDEALPQIASLCTRPLVLGRSVSTEAHRQRPVTDLKSHGLSPLQDQLHFDCCEQDLQRLASTSEGCDAVLAAGGGKVLDAGKLLAHRLELPCITVPLSASTCAGWTALTNVYSSKGAFERDVAGHTHRDDLGQRRRLPARTARQQLPVTAPSPFPSSSPQLLKPDSLNPVS